MTTQITFEVKNPNAVATYGQIQRIKLKRKERNSQPF